jgi:hypothetical protein
MIGEAFLLGLDEVQLYDKVNGKVIGQIQNNDNREVYYSFDVFNQKDDWFLVQATAINDTLTGWILNKSLMATYSRNYTDTLFIYSDTNSKYSFCEIPNYFTSPMKIIEYKGSWVKVEIEDKDLLCKGGWIKRSMTCSNPYTTCP